MGSHTVGLSEGHMYQVYLQFWGIFSHDLGTHSSFPKFVHSMRVLLKLFFASPQYRPLEHIVKRHVCSRNWLALMEQKYLWKQKLCIYVYFVFKYMWLRTALQKKFTNHLLTQYLEISTTEIIKWNTKFMCWKYGYLYSLTSWIKLCKA